MQTAKEFLDVAHISGYTRSRHKLGLVHKPKGLAGIATTRTPNTDEMGVSLSWLEWRSFQALQFEAAHQSFLLT